MSAKPRQLILRILGGLVIAGSIFWAVRPKEVQVKTATAEISDFVERIQAEGVFRSKTRIIVPAFAMGEMGRVDLRVGDSIKKGAFITTLFWDMEQGPLRSPITGVVSKVFRESAGPVQRGEPILEVIDPKNLEIATEVLTLDATRIRKGNPALIRGWGGEGEIPARVLRVSKAGFVKISTLGVEEERTEVVLELLSNVKRVTREWGSTFHVDIEIEVSRLPRQLVIPVGALVREGEGWMVWKVVKGRAQATPIRVQAISGGLVALMQKPDKQGESVGVGEALILYPGDIISKNIKVRPQGAKALGR